VSGESRKASPALLDALDQAIVTVRRLEAGGLCTATGRSAAQLLGELLAELTARRAEVAAGGRIDREWAGRLVRGVAAWVPDDELPLLARLGALVRASEQA
jgi:hypothetical protein